MRIRRFFFCVLLAYVIGFSVSAAIASLLRVEYNPTLLLLIFFSVSVSTTMCGWLYFRGVRSASLGLCVQWALVWMGLFFFTDLLLTVLWLHVSVQDIHPMIWAGYLVQFLGLLLSAWLTRATVVIGSAVGEHESVESPNLRLSI